MIVLLLQQTHELAAITPGLRIPERPLPTHPWPAAPLPIESGLSILFGRGLHFDDMGTCYVWHADGNCYALPLHIWSHPASPVRSRIMLHWPYGEQLSFWHELMEHSSSPVDMQQTPSDTGAESPCRS
ncbi:MAG TPA: hypothetical protein VHI13_15670 [Candidatus Kapabacteria bacterium]|nr:hypothetical protein [Candidatus Kapabacteria bacterium]